jgi:hypothetical protein
MPGVESGVDLDIIGDEPSLIAGRDDPARAAMAARPKDALDGRRRLAGTAGAHV